MDGQHERKRKAAAARQTERDQDDDDAQDRDHDQEQDGHDGDDRSDGDDQGPRQQAAATQDKSQRASPSATTHKRSKRDASAASPELTPSMPCSSPSSVWLSADLDLRAGSESFIGRKERNEDRAMQDLHGFPGPVFALLDGHGGTQTVDLVVRHLFKTIRHTSKTHMGVKRVERMTILRHAAQEHHARREELLAEMDTCKQRLEDIASVLQDGAEDTPREDFQQLEQQLQAAMDAMQTEIATLDEDQATRDDAMARAWDEGDAALRKGCVDAFRQIDAQVLQKSTARDGATALLAWLIGDKPSHLHLVTANLGDSRGVLCRGGVAVPVTNDHKPGVPSERRRIIDAGGYVGDFHGISRAYSAAGAGLSVIPERTTYLAVSRAFGDRSLKIPTAVISCEPEIRRFRIQDDDVLLVLATDGVWDVLRNQEVVELALKHWGSPKAAADAIVKQAYERGSLDNITVTVIEFGWQDARIQEIIEHRDRVKDRVIETASDTSTSDGEGTARAAAQQASQDQGEDEVDMFNL